jgi:CarD family transcriptional regulator
MAARKKATKKASRTVAKKAKASAGSTASRKRKTAARASASRPSRSAAKSKAARLAKAKSSKSEIARRSAASAKARATPKRATANATLKARAAAPATQPPSTSAAKPGRPLDVKLQANEGRPREPSKALGQEPSGAVEAKAGAAALAKRAPLAAKPFKPGAADGAVERDEDGAAPKTVKSSGQRQGFKLNEFVVYPAHGVGQIVAVEDQEVAGFRLELFVINFAKDKMTLRVPTSKVAGVGMRKLSEPEAAKRSLEILTGRARIKRTMWSRRAQEYEAKINSGDINAIAEVVRDLYRSDAQPEQSYSERQLYEAALDRMMREIAAVQKLSEIDALKVIDAQLKKAQRRGAKPEGAEGEDAAIEEAA